MCEHANVMTEATNRLSSCHFFREFITSFQDLAGSRASWIFFFCPILEKFYPLFEHFAQMGSWMPRWGLFVPTYKFRPGWQCVTLSQCPCTRSSCCILPPFNGALKVATHCCVWKNPSLVLLGQEEGCHLTEICKWSQVNMLWGKEKNLGKNGPNWDIWNQSPRYFLLEFYHQYRNFCLIWVLSAIESKFQTSFEFLWRKSEKLLRVWSAAAIRLDLDWASDLIEVGKFHFN